MKGGIMFLSLGFPWRERRCLEGFPGYRRRIENLKIAFLSFLVTRRINQEF
jgi:hypothetical protein